jgi:hypothetical protein
MKAPVAAIAGLAIAAAAPASAQEITAATALQMLQRMILQYGVLVSRSFIDLTYENIAVEPGTGDVILTGLRLYPELDWDQDRRCVISVTRLVTADAYGRETLGSTLALDGVEIPPPCLQPEASATLSAFGYDGLEIENVAIDLDYHIPSSSADLALSASVANAAEIGLTAHFDYLWFRVPVTDPSDPAAATADAVPVARLGRAELILRNDGLFEALEPMIAEQFGGDLSAIPQNVQMSLGEALTEGGTRTPTAEETAFVDELATGLARFIENRDRIVITVEPEGGSVLLTEEMTGSPAALIAALDPVVSAVPSAFRRMIAPAELAAALSGGATLDDETRLRVGEALVTGVGAPRAVAAGRALLAPLAEDWDPRAALLTASADREAGDPQAAYSMALRAMAGGESAAIGLADELEAELPLVVVLNAQADIGDGWPGADEAVAEADRLISEGDVAGIRERAQAAALGRDRPRDYAEAYFWASLAAAAGDRRAAALRERLDARFAGQNGWAETVAAQQANALETWTGGLAETIAARME